MNFSKTLDLIKQGSKVSRIGWNNRNLCIIYQKGYVDGVIASQNIKDIFNFEDDTVIKVEPYFNIVRVTDDGGLVFNTWTPTISDILADDWIIFDYLVVRQIKSTD